MNYLLSLWRDACGGFAPLSQRCFSCICADVFCISQGLPDYNVTQGAIPFSTTSFNYGEDCKQLTKQLPMHILKVMCMEYVATPIDTARSICASPLLDHAARIDLKNQLGYEDASLPQRKVDHLRPVSLLFIKNCPISHPLIIYPLPCFPLF